MGAPFTGALAWALVPLVPLAAQGTEGTALPAAEGLDPERLEEFAGQPWALVAVAAVLALFGAFLLPLRAAIERSSVEPAPPARAVFCWLDVVAVVLAFIVSQFVAGYAYLAALHGALPEDQAAAEELFEELPFVHTMSLLGISFLCACLVAVGIGLRRPGGAEALGLARPARARFPLGRHVTALASYLLGLPFLFAAAAATTAYFAFGGLEVPQQEVAVSIQEHIESQPVLVVGFAVVLIPLFEEILFRGFLLELLVAKLGRAGGVVLTSLLFAVAHGLAASPVIFVLAVVLATVKLRTRSLLPVWILHGLHNGLTLLAQSAGILD